MQGCCLESLTLFSGTEMEFTVRHLKIGTLESFDYFVKEDNKGVLSAKSISLNVRYSAHTLCQPSVPMIILLKDIISCEASFETVQSFLSILLKHLAAG